MKKYIKIFSLFFSLTICFNIYLLAQTKNNVRIKWISRRTLFPEMVISDSLPRALVSTSKPEVFTINKRYKFSSQTVISLDSSFIRILKRSTFSKYYDSNNSKFYVLKKTITTENASYYFILEKLGLPEWKHTLFAPDLLLFIMCVRDKKTVKVEQIDWTPINRFNLYSFQPDFESGFLLNSDNDLFIYNKENEDKRMKRRRPRKSNNWTFFNSEYECLKIKL
jgi:hypothetical protein